MSRIKKILILDLVLVLLVCMAAVSYRTGFLKRLAGMRTDPSKTAELICGQANTVAGNAEAAESSLKASELDQWYLLLVNEWNGIPDDFKVETADVEDGYVVDERIRDELKEMLDDCREAGHSPKIISSFRTRDTQQYLYDHTANKADTALPGHSEHECGLAADIIDADSAGWGDPLIDKQEEMPAQKWLMQHCRDYGFILRYPKDKQTITGIVYEPWHYRYVGKTHAKTIMERGICLEEYIEELEKLKR